MGTESSSTELHLWNKIFRKGDDNNDDNSFQITEDKVKKITDETENDLIKEEGGKEEDQTKKNGTFENKPGSFRSRLPFFASEVTANDDDNTRNTDDESTSTQLSTPPLAKPSKKKVVTKKVDPLSYAKELKRQATKARLEAEKMDAQLTLEKISTLELKLS